MKRSKEGREAPAGADYSNGEPARNGAFGGCSQIAGKASAGRLREPSGRCAQRVHEAVDGAAPGRGDGAVRVYSRPLVHPDREP